MSFLCPTHTVLSNYNDWTSISIKKNVTVISSDQKWTASSGLESIIASNSQFDFELILLSKYNTND